jgi:hypothetical protein
MFRNCQKMIAADRRGGPHLARLLRLGLRHTKANAGLIIQELEVNASTPMHGMS